MELHFSYKIDHLFNKKDGSWFYGDALYVFAQALDTCGMATEWVEECPVDLLDAVAHNFPIPDSAFLDGMKQEASRCLLDKAKRNAEMIPELEAMLAGKAAA